MNKIDSKMTLATWAFFLVVTAGEAFAALLTKGAAAFVLVLAGLLIPLSGAMIFDQNTGQKKTADIILWIACAAVTVLCGHPFSGLAGLIPSSLPLLNGKKALFIPASLYAAAGVVIYLITGTYTRNMALIYPAVLIAAVVLWAAAAQLTSNYIRSLEDLKEALRNSSLDSLSERTLREELAKQNELSKMNAKLEERERISRDIHNSVGHTLAAAAVTLDAAALLVGEDDDLATAKMQQANSRVREAMDSIRSAVRTLDSDDDTLLLSDYAASLSENVKGFAMDTGVGVHHNLDMITDQTKIPIDIAAFLSGALSELLSNGIRHGKATVFVIVLAVSSGSISLKVQDNGCGWGDASKEEREVRIKNGFGIRKTQDKARSLGGNMTIDGNDGFEVRIDLPLIVGKE